VLTRFDFTRPRTIIVAALLIGAVAGLFGAAFAKVVTEPRVDDAIALEDARAAADPGPAEDDDMAIVPRADQSGPGLFAAYAIAGAAYGLFLSVTALSLRLVSGGVFRRVVLAGTILAGALTVAPWLKYPPNPPAVGDPETIGERTAYYLVLLVGSALAMFAAARVMWSMKPDAAPWARPLAGAGTFIVVAGGLALALPGIQEVPRDFPAPLIWEFRLSSLGTQAVLWAALGIGFGIATMRAAGATSSAVAGDRSVAAR
jgi:hypothetical protein